MSSPHWMKKKINQDIQYMSEAASNFFSLIIGGFLQLFFQGQNRRHGPLKVVSERLLEESKEFHVYKRYKNKKLPFPKM
jgi:hypothetical protein